MSAALPTEGELILQGMNPGECALYSTDGRLEGFAPIGEPRPMIYVRPLPIPRSEWLARADVDRVEIPTERFDRVGPMHYRRQP